MTDSTTSEPSLGTRLASAMGDAKLLVEQHAHLVYAEVQADLQRFVNSLILLFAGLASLVPGLFLLAHMCVYLIHWKIEPRASESQLWIGYATVGGLLLVVGGICLGAGIVGVRAFNPLPDRSIAIFWKSVGNVVDSTKA